MVYTPQRLMPDVDALVLAVLTAGTVRAAMEPPANLYALVDNGPFTVAYRFGGQSFPLPLADNATVQIICYGKSRKIAADCAETCRVLLWQAAQTQTVFGDAYINQFRVVAPAANMPDTNLPSRVWRCDLTVSVRVRPA